MKKLLYFASLILALAVVSCEKEKIGGTAVEKVSGEWYVTCDIVTEGDKISLQYLYDLGDIESTHFIVRTYNTASNESNKMWISDMQQYGSGYDGAYVIGGFRVLADVDQATGNFSTPDYVKNAEVSKEYAAWDIPAFADIKIANGKISYDGGKQINGSVADAIEFDLYVKNGYLDQALIQHLYYDFGIELDFEVDHLHFTGVRYSGLVENDYVDHVSEE